MKNPNFLILDAPTNDLDILTLQALEDFLEEFQGCLLIVSHDRYFLDKLCQHLFIFEGEGKIKDFNGSYYQWREEKKRLTSIKIKAPNSQKILKKNNLTVKTKLNYSEKREWNNLPIEISALEKKRDELNKVFESNNQDADTIIQASKDIKIIIAELDEKEMRWLELSELGDI